MFLSVLLALTFALAANAHSITVKGVFYCEHDHKLPVYVELMEEDHFKDDRLQWLQTMAHEKFEIKGTEDEFIFIRPYLRVFHKCRGIEEIITINFGNRDGDQTIDIGDVYLDDPRTKKAIRNKFRFFP
ncbi:Transthyretin-like family protein [Ancylostoma caninum]|uniref:Transthyretin-like family protein n=1 Tax=Ancylostoma caninum TaxID=29170 RepID=A0A368FEX8_ANCCA|nr:Transthyretin-like family protein [Ancylostoma caninum]